MPQHDFTLDGLQTMAGFEIDLNNAIAALVTESSGSTPPLVTYPFQDWIDTSTAPPTIKKRNAANNAWIITGKVEANLGLIDASQANTLINSRVRAIATNQSPSGFLARGEWFTNPLTTAIANPGGEYSTGNTRFTAASAGLYQISHTATVVTNTNTTPSATLLLIGISINGVDRVIGGASFQRDYAVATGADFVTLAANDIVIPRLFVEFTGGISFNSVVAATPNFPKFAVLKLT